MGRGGGEGLSLFSPSPLLNMFKLVVSFAVWCVSFLILLPSDKPMWMGIVAAFATFQVMAMYINDTYNLLLNILEIVSFEALLKIKKESLLKDEEDNQ